jgi:hypothetical protein
MLSCDKNLKLILVYHINVHVKCRKWEYILQSNVELRYRITRQNQIAWWKWSLPNTVVLLPGVRNIINTEFRLRSTDFLFNIKARKSSTSACAHEYWLLRGIGTTAKYNGYIWMYIKSECCEWIKYLLLGVSHVAYEVLELQRETILSPFPVFKDCS